MLGDSQTCMTAKRATLGHEGRRTQALLEFSIALKQGLSEGCGSENRRVEDLTPALWSRPRRTRVQTSALL